MFKPIYLLPQFNIEKLKKYRERWNTPDGRKLQDKILQLIRNGAGEDFLQWYWEKNELGFLEDMWDLKGISIFKENVDFPIKDNFEGIDFSYSKFYHSEFRNATILGNTSFSFSKFYNCKFTHCIFLNTGFFGATLEKTIFSNCDFISENRITNCDVTDSIFEDCFYVDRLFFDCRFNETTFVDKPREKPSYKKAREKMDRNKLSSIYNGIKEGYSAGNITRKSRQYFYKQRKCSTRYNSRNLKEKMGGYFLEWIAGYGVKPSQVLLNMFIEKKWGQAGL